MDFFKTFLAAGAVAMIGGVSHAATIDFIYESDGPSPPGVNDCSGDFGTDGSCVYVSEDDYYFDGAGSATAGVGSSYETNGYGSLDQIVKIDDPFGADDDMFSFFVNLEGDLTWTYNPGESNIAVFAFSVKGGNRYNVWEFSDAPTGGEQTASGWFAFSGDSDEAISHVTFFGKEVDPINPIPLPAAGWLLLGGLGGLAAMKRRRKS